MLSKEDKEIKNYKLTSDYFQDIFKIRQKCISINSIDNIIKTYNNYNKNILQNKMQKLIIGASATTTITLITGGLGCMFAPQIAIALAGESVAGLSGAALTSASLAFVGGGSLAAGGLGMADACSKLLTFSKLILANKLKDYTSIKTLKKYIDIVLEKLENDNAVKEKNVKTNIKYLSKCSKVLEEMIKNESTK